MTTWFAEFVIVMAEAMGGFAPVRVEVNVDLGTRVVGPFVWWTDDQEQGKEFHRNLTLCGLFEVDYLAVMDAARLALAGDECWKWHFGQPSPERRGRVASIEVSSDCEIVSSQTMARLDKMMVVRAVYQYKVG